MTSMQGLLECPVCSDIDKEPKILPCFHHVCVDCIENILDISSECSYDSDDSYSGEPKIKCPICRTTVKIPSEGASGLPVDFKLVQMREYYHKTSQSGGRGREK